jgi:hypothetical protein
VPVRVYERPTTEGTKRTTAHRLWVP